MTKDLKVVKGYDKN